jgi:conjugal transfer pilus assembly protein TraV
MYTQSLKTASAPLLGLAFCFNLCACSTTSETFDCPAGKGVGCKSISEINQMVDSNTRVQGRPGEGYVERGVQPTTPLSTPVISADTHVVDSPGVNTLPEISLSDTMAVHRIQEEHLRVWIAPYQDTQGNLHEGSIVHTVLRPGSWQVRVTDPRVADSRVSDPSVSDASISDTNIDDPGTAGPQSSDSEEYP